MARPPAKPVTALGAEVQRKRGGVSLRTAAEEAGVPDTTLSRIERGTHRPSYDTARAIATWLGWTVDEVMVAAEAPVDPPSSEIGHNSS